GEATRPGERERPAPAVGCRQSEPEPDRSGDLVPRRRDQPVAEGDGERARQPQVDRLPGGGDATSVDIAAARRLRRVREAAVLPVQLPARRVRGRACEGEEAERERRRSEET